MHSSHEGLLIYYAAFHSVQMIFSFLSPRVAYSFFFPSGMEINFINEYKQIIQSSSSRMSSVVSFINATIISEELVAMQTKDSVELSCLFSVCHYISI